MSEGSSLSTVYFSVTNSIAELRLNRPEVLNAINSAMITYIGHALDLAEANPAVRAIVVTGEGRAFSAGFDLKESAARGETSEAQWRQILKADFDIIMRFWDSPKPTIAAIHGACIGGGFEIALACDITLAADTAVMGEPEVRFGSGIVALLLPWVTGPKQAKEILLAGVDRMDAMRALSFGLVNRVVPAQVLRDEAMALAHAITLGGADSVRLTKVAINRTYEIMGMRQSLKQALEIDIAIETAGGPERCEFNQIRRESGLKAAIAWRKARGTAPG